LEGGKGKTRAKGTKSGGKIDLGVHRGDTEKPVLNKQGGGEKRLKTANSGRCQLGGGGDR